MNAKLNSLPTKLKDLIAFDKAMLKIAMTSRWTVGWGPNSKRSMAPTEQTLRHAVDSTAKCGYYGAYGDFNAEEAAEWLVKIAAFLTEESVPTVEGHRLGLKPYAPLEDGLAAAAMHIEQALDEARENVQAEYDDDPEGFRQWHRDAVVVDGKVTNPWGQWGDIVQWLMDEMTPFGVFAFYLKVRQDVDDCVAENISVWAEGGEGESPAKVAEKSFADCMDGLHDHIVEAIEAQEASASNKAEWDSHPLAP